MNNFWNKRKLNASGWILNKYIERLWNQESEEPVISELNWAYKDEVEYPIWKKDLESLKGNLLKETHVLKIAKAATNGAP